jgi:hypothetical protein
VVKPRKRLSERATGELARTKVCLGLLVGLTSERLEEKKKIEMGMQVREIKKATDFDNRKSGSFDRPQQLQPNKAKERSSRNHRGPQN